MTSVCTLCNIPNYLYPTGCSSNHECCIFCLKGLVLSCSPPNTNRSVISCPYCKRNSSPKYFRQLNEHPETIRNHNILDQLNILHLKRDHHWLYSGRNNGWWYFNDELQTVLEKHYQKIDKDKKAAIGCINECFTWMICGQQLEFDLVNMRQTNLESRSIRDIKRISSGQLEGNSLLIKGIAGMK